MSSTKREILQQLRSLLLYHEASGIQAYVRSEDAAGFLRTMIAPHRQSVVTGAKTATLKPAAAQSPKRQQHFHGSIGEISDEVKIRCRCGLSANRVVAVPGRGSERARLFIVGGWLMTGSEQGSGDLVFGREEDLMLARMVQAIHLSPEDVFITNIIKCGIAKNVQPKAENIAACRSYLERQIAAISPEVICTMGIAATHALLHNSQPLSRLRGVVHQYSLDRQRTFPLIPTYHPTFLLQNPEMKKATWADLQLIEKLLQH